MHRLSRRLLPTVLGTALMVGAAGAASAQEAPPAAAPEQTVTLTAEERARYVGIYDMETPEGAMSIRVYEEGDALLGMPEHEDEPSVLTPLGDHRFRPVLLRDAVLRFVVENDRAISFAIDFPDERGTVMAFRRP